jgi:hypothetical protein
LPTRHDTSNAASQCRSTPGIECAGFIPREYPTPRAIATRRPRSAVPGASCRGAPRRSTATGRRRLAVSSRPARRVHRFLGCR